MTIDFKRYETFVDVVTSDASKDFVNLADRMVELDGQGANIEKLLTSAVGMSAEAGEFTEIVKEDGVSRNLGTEQTNIILSQNWVISCGM